MIDRILFSQPWFYALGLTLLHSLWHGALIAALLWLLLRLCRDFPARLRYGLTVMAMLLWFAAAALTYSYLAGSPGPPPPAGLMAEAARTTSLSIGALLENRFDPAAAVPFFMLFWLAGLVFMSARTLAGLFVVHSLKHRAIYPLPREWQVRIGAWLKEWQVNRMMPVYLSARVHTPAVVGFFRQTLLLPLSFLTSLPPEQVQVVLAHEVAHFLRRDALVNLFQTLMETLFFYHPALWWISARMREEREFCCDDYAIARCGHPMVLARALVDMEKLQTTPLRPVPVLSAAGRLQQRVTRRFKSKENAMELHEKLLALLMLIGLGLVLVPLQGLSKSANGTAADLRDDQKKKIEVRVVTEGEKEKVFTVISPDSGAKENEKVLVVKGDDGEEHVFKIKSGKTVSVTKDGKEIPLEELKKEMIDDELLDWDADEDEDKDRVITIESCGDDSTRKHITVKVMDADEDSSLWNVTKDHEKIITINSDGDSVKKRILVRVREGEKDFTITHRDSVRKKVRIVHEHDKARKTHQQQETAGKEIRAQLAKDGFSGDQPVEFKITEKELFINGIKQSDEAFEKYRQILSTSMGLDKEARMEIILKFKQEKKN